MMLDVYIEGKRIRFINSYAPVTRSDTNSFFKDLYQHLLEPLPHVLLGVFNSAVDSQRDVRGPGQGGSTYHAKELVKILRHLSLTEVWDEVCVQRVRDRILESLENVRSLTPHVWDTLKEGWKKLLKEEGRDRKRRLSARMGEILRRMRIVNEAESLTSCTREYLETLQATYTHLLQLKTQRPAKDPGPPDSSTDPGLRTCTGMVA
ncbi:hypothetical protein HPB50_007908 [Hyalomma asiaticum]|uniref:Uncharacterized protein n=1 Tax=Hyalomma asiaticum TaxID=266040 RepID=A0ACB7TGT4_HYAAI|nr:hypothetical protein HPB50_007908 [Hyalomma asiaticum]